VALSSLGRALTLLGRHGEAAERFAEGAALFAEAGDPESQAGALGDSGRARAEEGDLTAAIELHDAALAILGDAVEKVSRTLPGHGAEDGGPGAPLPKRRHAKSALLRSLAELYRQQGEADKATEFEAAARELEDGPW
jgi:tetratricopeptide (TPR) repeat protein